MQKLVIDSSVIVKWLNEQDEELLDQADKIMLDVQDEKVVLFAPELAKYEIGNAILSKELSLNESKITFNNLYLFPIQFLNQTEELANKTYQIAKETGITYYDASFITLAIQEDAALITDNIKHQGKYKGIEVIALKDYS